MKRILIIIALCLPAFINAEAQELYNSTGTRVSAHPKKKAEPKGFDRQKLIFGGGLGLNFGQVTVVSLTPVIGYRLTEHFSAGIGFGYLYYKEKDHYLLQGESYDLKASMMYPSVWARYVVFSNFFVHAEYEQDFISQTALRYDQSGSGTIESFQDKYNSPALLLGVGLRQPITENSSMVLSAAYDVLEDVNSPYYHQIDFRVGFNVGF